MKFAAQALRQRIGQLGGGLNGCRLRLLLLSLTNRERYKHQCGRDD
jgi:hypothetical protein